MLFDFKTPNHNAGERKHASQSKLGHDGDEDDLQLEEDLRPHSQLPTWNLMTTANKTCRKRAFEWDDDGDDEMKCDAPPVKCNKGRQVS
jgi:hypothetical protein